MTNEQLPGGHDNLLDTIIFYSLEEVEWPLLSHEGPPGGPGGPSGDVIRIAGFFPDRDHSGSPMKTLRLCIVASVLVFSSAHPVPAQDAPPRPDSSREKTVDCALLVKPYLQLGYRPEAGKLALLWHTIDADAHWSVDYRPGIGRRWQVAHTPSWQRISVPGVEPHRIYRTDLTGLELGQIFAYRLTCAGKLAFQAEGRAPRASDQPHRFVVFGDCGADTPQQREIAYRAFLSEPDLVMITGDIVYARGLISEYRTNYWPVYNADEPSPLAGAPLLRSTLFAAAPGNHDIAARDLGKTPDGLAYFYYWAQPLNGPTGAVGGPLVAPLAGPEENIRAFRSAAGDAFPRMANFSFDYGNAHWTVLDSNPTVQWSTCELKQWVASDLAGATQKTWRFVSFHHPGFSSSHTHFEEQAMRILAPVFEAGKVDIVWSGHVHNYQRSFPLRFLPDAAGAAGQSAATGGAPSKNRRVPGRWTLDKKFDGRSEAPPDGVIYVVTGAGGQHLYDPEQQDDPDSWQEFTYKFVAKVHTLTVADVKGATLTVRQLFADGREADRFVIKK
jgi:hypothetical protein